MTSNDKQYTIYLRSAEPGNRRIPCTKQQFDNYYRDINAYRRTQMNHGCCVCPPSKWLQCDMDCYTCPHRTSGDISSLDDCYTDDDGKELSWLDRLQEKMPDLQTPRLDDQMGEMLYAQELLKRLCEIMPQAIEIGKLRLEGLSEDSIAEEIGTGRKTYAYRLKKAAETLKKEFPEFF